MSRRAVLALLVLAAIAVAVAALVIRDRPGEAPPASTVGAAPTTTATTVLPAQPTTTAAATTTSREPTPPPMLPPGATVCDAYGPVAVVGTVTNPDLVEASGIAIGRENAGVVWAHNDSRDGPIAYAVAADGADLGAYRVGGAAAFDWEDMAAGRGPDPDVSYLYFGDIGDNFGIRGGVATVYRVVEPRLGSAGLSADALGLRYPRGEAHNAEGLMIDPRDGSLYVVTRNPEVALVYRADGSAPGGTIQDLELVVSLPLGDPVTAADISWDGSRIAFRGERHVWMWHRAAGQDVATALGAPPCEGPSPDERQGEAIGFAADGSYATVSEGLQPDLHVVPAAF